MSVVSRVRALFFKKPKKPRRLRPLQERLNPEQSAYLEERRKATNGAPLFLKQTRLSRGFLRRNKGLFSKVINLIRDKQKELQTSENVCIDLGGGVVVTKEYNGDLEGRKRGGFLLKVTSPKGVFFLKKRFDLLTSKWLKTMVKQYETLDRVLAAKNHKLFGLNIEVLQPHLLYREQDAWVFVSDFLLDKNLVLVHKLGKHTGSAKGVTERIKRRAERAARAKCDAALDKIISDLPYEMRGGVGPVNSFYDAKRKRLILFDLEPNDRFGRHQLE